MTVPGRRAAIARAVVLMSSTFLCGGAQAGDTKPGAPLESATNLDFEATVTASGAPPGWSMTHPGYALTVDSDGVHGGKACARVARLAEDVEARSWIAMVTQTIAAAPYRGKRVRLSGFLRMKDVTGFVAMRIRVSDAAKEPLAADRNQDHARKGTQGWAQDSLVVDVAEKAETIEYGIWLSGDGTAWLDDFVLETVGKDVPSTDVMSYPASPTNLDFEGPAHPRGMPLYWLGGAPDYECAYDSNSPHGGKRSAKLAWSAEVEPDAQSYSLLGQATPAASWRGKRVRFAGWVRTKDATGGGAALWFRADDAAEKIVAFDNMQQFEIQGTTGWTLCELVLDIPQTATRLTYGMRFSGGGSAWCDDLEFGAVGPEVPCTDDQPSMRPVLAASAEKANLDFEGGADAGGRPTGWRGGNRGYAPSVDTKVFRGGKSSGRLTATAAQASHPDSSGSLMCAVPAAPYRGKRVRLAGSVRTEKASAESNAGVALGLAVEGGRPGEMLAVDEMDGRRLHGDADWTVCTIVLDVPEAAQTLLLGVQISGSGCAWFDDLTIDVVGADVPCTDKK